MLQFLLAVLFFLKWYFYLYLCSFVLIIIFSLFKTEVGIRRIGVNILYKIFEYIEDTKRKALLEHVTRKRSINASEKNNLYSNAVLENGEKDCDVPKYSFTIERDIIFTPELRCNEQTELTDEDVEFSQSLENVYDWSDPMSYIKGGIEAIVEDQITSRFEAEKLETWNLLTRHEYCMNFYSWQIAVLYAVGLVIRYTIVIPYRILSFFFGISLLVLSAYLIGRVPDCKLKRRVYRVINIAVFQVLSRWLGAVLNFHNIENRPRSGVVVSNHTTPFDVLMLNNDNVYSLTGQKQGGVIGFLERTLSAASPHIWFDRNIMSDRGEVARRLREHVKTPFNPPILIFPEGTCINNTAVTQFRKGGFEVSDTVHPIAIKYDPRFGDAFWNSSKQTGGQHVWEMMTGWAIVADIWYLPAMRRKQNESATQFANRVKARIAEQMKVVDLTWDGQVKRVKPKPEFREHHRKLFREQLKSRMRNIAQ